MPISWAGKWAASATPEVKAAWARLAVPPLGSWHPDPVPGMEWLWRPPVARYPGHVRLNTLYAPAHHGGFAFCWLLLCESDLPADRVGVLYFFDQDKPSHNYGYTGDGGFTSPDGMYGLYEAAVFVADGAAGERLWAVPVVDRRYFNNLGTSPSLARGGRKNNAIIFRSPHDHRAFAQAAGPEGVWQDCVDAANGNVRTVAGTSATYEQAAADWNANRPGILANLADGGEARTPNTLELPDRVRVIFNGPLWYGHTAFTQATLGPVEGLLYDTGAYYRDYDLADVIDLGGARRPYSGGLPTPRPFYPQLTRERPPFVGPGDDIGAGFVYGAPTDATFPYPDRTQSFADAMHQALVLMLGLLSVPFRMVLGGLVLPAGSTGGLVGMVEVRADDGEVVLHGRDPDTAWWGTDPAQHVTQAARWQQSGEVTGGTTQTQILGRGPKVLGRAAVGLGEVRDELVASMAMSGDGAAGYAAYFRDAQLQVFTTSPTSLNQLLPAAGPPAQVPAPFLWAPDSIGNSLVCFGPAYIASAGGVQANPYSPSYLPSGGDLVVGGTGRVGAGAAAGVSGALVLSAVAYPGSRASLWMQSGFDPAASMSTLRDTFVLASGSAAYGTIGSDTPAAPGVYADPNVTVYGGMYYTGGQVGSSLGDLGPAGGVHSIAQAAHGTGAAFPYNQSGGAKAYVTGAVHAYGGFIVGPLFPARYFGSSPGDFTAGPVPGNAGNLTYLGQTGRVGLPGWPTNTVLHFAGGIYVGSSSETGTLLGLLNAGRY